MAQHIIFNHPITGIANVITPTNEFKGTMDELAQSHVPAGATYQIIEGFNIPQEYRTFRNAWVVGTDKIDVDRPKAEAIQMDRIRKLRDIQLEKLDIDSVKALESGDTVKLAEVAAKKQELRDIPQTTDLSKVLLSQLADFKPVIVEGDIKGLKSTTFK